MRTIYHLLPDQAQWAWSGEAQDAAWSTGLVQMTLYAIGCLASLPCLPCVKQGKSGSRKIVSNLERNVLLFSRPFCRANSNRWQNGATQSNGAIQSNGACHLVLWTSLLYRQWDIIVSVSSDKCTYFKSLRITASAKPMQSIVCSKWIVFLCWNLWHVSCNV